MLAVLMFGMVLLEKRAFSDLSDIQKEVFFMRIKVEGDHGWAMLKQQREEDFNLKKSKFWDKTSVLVKFGFMMLDACLLGHTTFDMIIAIDCLIRNIDLKTRQIDICVLS